jgi:large subunit ribosomal protein L3
VTIEGILGRKLGMTQLFDETGVVRPVTVVQASPNVVLQVKTATLDGYEAVQVGFGERKRINKPERGHAKDHGKPEILREFAVDNIGDWTVGQTVGAEVFENGAVVDVVGTSKGKGFAGGVKRHHFSGGPKTHGQSDRHRAPGSVGAGTTPGRVWKNTRMAGHMGARRVTVRNIVVLQSDPERGLLFLRGAVPGANNGIVQIRRARKPSKR